MRRDLDAIVLGGGVMGTSAARALASRGRSTLVLERGEIGGDAGSSSGRTRIFRLAYHEPGYVRLAVRALEAWRELEDAAGERLLHTTGAVDAGRASLVCADAMAAVGVRFERTTPERIAERWPALRFARGETLVVQEDGGVCLVKETIAAQARLAREAGAELLERTEASTLRPSGRGVEIVTAAGHALRARVVVLAAGPWNARWLAGMGVDLALRPTFEQPTHLVLSQPSALPTLVDRSPDPDAPRYAVPDPLDARAVKVGTHLCRTPVDPDALGVADDRERQIADEAYARERFRGVEPTGRVDRCVYTMTPDEDFVLDRRDDVVICSPCSGHGFKFAPLIGEIVADLLEGRASRVPIGRFSAARPALSAPV